MEKEINLENKPNVDEETANDFVINLFILFYHESMGYQEFAYMELAYGKFGRNLIIKMMSQVKDKGNLIKRIDLFTDEKCDILKKYIILKFFGERKKN